MNKILLLIIFWALTAFHVQATNPISSKDLFRNPETFSMKLNPEGSFIVSYGQNEDSNFFELIDPKSQQSFLLLSLPFHNDFKLIEYDWVDNQTVYIALNKKKGFLHLDLEGKIPSGKYTAIQSRGYLVSALPDQEDKVLFANNIGVNKTKYVLVNASTTQLERDSLEGKDVLDLSLDKALHYFYDESNNAFLAYTFKDENVTFWLLKSNTTTWKPFWAIDKEIDFTPVGLLSENKLAVLTNQDEDLISLREFDITTQTLGKVLFKHSMYDLTGAALAPMGEGVKSVDFIDHGIPTTHYFAKDEKKLKRELTLTFNNQQLAVVSSNLDDSKKIVLILNSDNPGKYYLYDSETNKAQYLKNKSPHLDSYELARSTLLTVNVETDVNVEAMLTMPKSDGNGVLLVYPHGGPIGVRDYATYDPQVQYLVSRGYSVLTVNFRGSSGFGKAFLERGKGQFGQLIEQDITTVVNSVKKQHKFTNTCSIGSSYGGYSAVMLAMKHPSDYQCVIAMYGVYDLPLLFNSSNYETQDENRKQVAEIVGEFDESLKKFSPFYIAQKLQAPILLIAGDQDEVTYLEQTNRMKYRLKQLNKDVEQIIYKNVGHGQHNWFGESHQFAYIDQFIKRKLKLTEVITEAAKPTFAQDAVVIADAYDSGKLLPKDLALAFSFYQKAADLGESRAMFNIGSYYHRGVEVEKSMSEAISWYEKASNAGYASASYRLAMLYKNGEHVEKDVDYMYKKLLMATEQKKHYEIAEIGMSGALCLGEGVSIDTEKCFSRLFYLEQPNIKISNLKRPIYDKWREVLTEVIWHNDFNEKTAAKFKEHIKSTLAITHFDIYAEEEDFGIFKNINLRRGKITETNIVPIEKGVTFGASLFIDTEQSLDKKNTNLTMIKVKWILPKSIQGKSIFQSKVTYLEKKTNIGFTLTEDDKLVPGEWTLQVYSLEDKLIYEKKFYTVEATN